MEKLPASPANWAALIGATVLAPTVVRVTQILDHRLAMRLADCRGFLADLAVSLLLAAGIAVLAKTPRVGRWVGVTLIVIWSLVNFANYEHIRELGSVVNLSHAGYVTDATFLRGSVLAPTHPVLLVLTTLISLIVVLYAVSTGRQYRARLLLLAAVPLTAVAALTPRAGEISSWRQTDLVTAQISRVFKTPLARGASSQVEFDRLADRDLDGTPIITSEPRARNVLLVILEGVSGAYLPSLRRLHGASSSVTMPELDRIARMGVSYSAFIATQRQTNRGEFALLCGDYPKLITAEANMTELVGMGPLGCLPSTMREAGFSTVYLQAAPLPFMMKDQFMPQAGFEQVYGDTWFKNAHNRNHWGVDDRSFFEQSIEMIEELSRGEDPWFLTLLTVGTHHRYNVPPDFEGEHEHGSAPWAFEYLDHAVGEFISQLDSIGVLENTLVLITSDESQAMEVGAPDWMNMVTQAWGFLIALLPSGEPGVVSQVFAQLDIPISVLDYLQIESPRREYAGRSVFRRYDSERAIYWGNTHLRMVAGLSPDLDLTICTEDFGLCGTFPTAKHLMFSPGKEMRTTTQEEINWLHGSAQRSLASHPGQLQQRRFVLIRSGRHQVLRTSSEQYIFGGQFLTVPAHSRTDVDIEVELNGAPGWVDFSHNFIVDRQPYYSWSERINVGETLRLRYSVGTESSLENAECRLWITDFEGDGLDLDVKSATLDLIPLPPSEPVPQTTVHVFEVE
jgi:phosphoglycerol transferase MdoB-like AlkP superfamily enzyme